MTQSFAHKSVVLSPLQEMLERQLEYERVRLEAESRKACLESQEKVGKRSEEERGWVREEVSGGSLRLRRYRVQVVLKLTKTVCLHVRGISAELFVSQERLRSQLANSLTSVNRSISRQSSSGSVQNKVRSFVRSRTETTRAQLNSLSLS